MNSIVRTIALSLTLTFLTLSAARAAVPNDVNGDGEIDVVDVQCVVLTILGPGLPDCLADADAADLNCSGETDVVDYQLMVLVVLSHPQPGVPADKDANGNNIHDDCEGGPNPVCGDGECNGDEDCTTCEQDCGVCGNNNPGDVIVTEFMKNPDETPDADGEWVELRNMTANPINLKGWKIKDLGGDSHTIAENVSLAAFGYALLAINGDTLLNCGVDADYVYVNFELDNDGSDEILVVAPDGTIIDEVVFNESSFHDQAGYSVMLSPSAMTAAKNDIGSNWCLGNKALDCGDWGTPGGVNFNCLPLPTCGNGNVEFGEDCEDGNTNSGDGCDENCQDEEIAGVCGNGKVEEGETCDDGNKVPGDGCDENCQKEGIVCGDGKKQGIEQCDDGNKIDGDGCSSDCKLEGNCGNGVVEQDKGEECDPPNPPACWDDCTLGYTDPFCGDGYLHELEECDDGNWENGDGCDANCKLEAGDLCGNNKLDGDEECDDGNKVPGDGCDPFCQFEKACSPSPCCGDGEVNAGEECDDSNLQNGDGCDSQCKTEGGGPACEPSPCCGDGEVDDGEACDDGNIDSNDGCSSECEWENECGNGQKEPGEECDDGNQVDGDGCTKDCLIEGVCGDNKLTAPEECDDGNTQNGDGCDSNCKLELISNCGDGQLTPPAEECDDGNKVDGDGCSSDCKIEGSNVTVKGTITYPGGGVGTTGKDRVGLVLTQAAPPDMFQPYGSFKWFTVPSFPYSYTFAGLPAGQFYVHAIFDKDGDGGDGDFIMLGPDDGVGFHLTMANPVKLTLQAGQTYTGKDIQLQSPQQGGP